MSDTIALDALARVYLKIKAARSVVATEYDKKIEELDAQIGLIQSEMRTQMQGLKVTSVKTEHGLIVMTKKTKYYTSDWTQFYEFIKKHDAPFLLEKRVAQGTMKQFLEDNPNEIPAGLNSDSSYEISVRKP